LTGTLPGPSADDKSALTGTLPGPSADDKSALTGTLPDPSADDKSPAFTLPRVTRADLEMKHAKKASWLLIAAMVVPLSTAAHAQSDPTLPESPKELTPLPTETVPISDDVAEDLCTDAVHDPVAIGLRDSGFDAGAGACVREQVFARTLAHGIIDTPGFYGQLGGELNVGASFIVTRGLQLGFGFRGIDFQFAQNAVSKASDLGYGPLALHVKASGNLELSDRPVYGAIFAHIAMPYTSAELQTVAVGGQLTGLLSFGLARSWLVHSRFGLVMGATSSGGGSTVRAAGRGGADLNWRLRTWIDVAVGLDFQGGWFRSFDHAMAKVAAHWRVHGRWRVETGLGVPLVGADRTNGVFTFGVSRDL
ncbi:MAG: hypothetical protein KBG15_08345, partial [Kofleriaceae bacterium]|nr:hypothetical protein [Kofleriaceae bacterium]